MGMVLPPDSNALHQCILTLKNGGVVVFPTETVYGIGADIRQSSAITRVIAIKGRPKTQPLLVHCADFEQAKPLITNHPPEASLLAEKFLPGSLALIFFRSPLVPDVVTGGGDTVGIRVVANPFFARLCRELGAPLVGSSANLSGQGATNDFSAINPKIIENADVAIDAGKTGSGLASTILDLTVKPFRLLRIGAIPPEEIEKLLGEKIRH